ncbi:acyl-CoA dehydrogenase family protein [Paeniglutamicibacter sp. Y32M11]|uniref:acyl-CoA dehydrogenase family protein n=1 Tax=Paeniglutamicibacter sp. Y32M11 TaxID=2853258 RepID=UPI001C52B682|nr:acyl-CoA dehydrogenase family protein [Paeniglutamicibacter sp. Y32M11]QXQ09828.1 acyl-CoA dehydrogenase family protein [Paeniglutamicibacter sp. Y32M11]
MTISLERTVTSVPGSAQPPRTKDLLERFAPVFGAITATTIESEATRTLAHQAVALLKDSGFTAIRVPQEFGGAGATLTQSLRLLRELGAADSNLVQALRAHFTTVETLVSGSDAAARERWLPRVVAGDVFGNATTEKGNKPGTNSTVLSKEKGRTVLNGTKYYSTGSLYADWIKVSADTSTGESVRVSVHRDTPGLELVDDWDGFGQRLTASGTTRFTNVEVDPENIDASGGVEGVGYGAAYVQAILLVALGGIARAVRRDAVDYVRGRERAFSHGVGDSPQRDPLVQEVVGRISSTVFAIDAVLDTVGARLEEAAVLSTAGQLDAEATAELDTKLSEAQIFVVEQTLDVANRLFEVGGASAASETRRLDRHWRNARVLGQHNPVIYRARAVGQQRLTGDQLTTPIYVGTRTTNGANA